MARYVDSALSAGEPILYDAKVHWAIFITPFLRIWFYVIVAVFFYVFAGFSGFRELLSFAGHTPLSAWVRAATPMFIAGAVFLVIIGLNLIHSIIYYYNSDFILTDRRVMSKFGLLSRTTSEQRLTKVESIQVYQSLLGRLLNFGNVTVTGTGSSTTTFGPMADPLACKRAIEAQLDLLKGPAEREG
ncbi:MAG: PH domain-containing protein [Asticcacaulis sp.]